MPRHRSLLAALLDPGEPLPDELRDALLPWLLAVALVIAGVELQRQWGSAASAVYGAHLTLIVALWLALAADGRRLRGRAGPLVDMVLLVPLAGGIVLGLLSGAAAGAELLRETLFWAPLLCAWWAFYYHGRPGRMLGLAAGLYGGLLATGQLSPPGRFPHEYLIQGALVLGLITLFLNAVARHQAGFGTGPAAFDIVRYDAVTGAASRPYFEAEMAHTAAMANRYGQPFSLVVAVIDDFADVPAERRPDLLREFAWLVIDRLRHADTLCRWEGEKFVALLPNTGVAAAREVGESMRATVARTGLAGRTGVTATIGVCQHHLGADPMATLAGAERAVQRARREGPNRLAVEEEPAAA